MFHFVCLADQKTEAIGSEPGLVEVILERADEGKSQFSKLI